MHTTEYALGDEETREKIVGAKWLTDPLACNIQ